ncbi:MAG: hypothetical protein RLZZ214_408, partial [Verrucomicrobiota bacterium]
MKASFFSPFLNLQPFNRRKRNPALLSVTVGLLFVTAAHATTYTYTAPNSSTTNTWSSGTGWSAVPVSAADTTLVFGGSFAGGFTATAQDNIAGAFQLNAMTLSASNSSTYTTTAYNVSPLAAGTNTLNFTNNGGTTAVVNLDSTKGVFNNSVNFNVSTNATIDGGLLTFQGSGSNSFNFSGILSNGSTAASIAKTGSSTLTLSGANTFTGGLTLSQGGLNINQSSALGAGTFTMASGVRIDNTSAADITTSANNNLQVWNGGFTWGGTKALNLGTGAVTLGANSIISVNGAGVLTVGGNISDGANSYGLTLGEVGSRNTGTVILNGVNTYDGGTVINSGFLQIAAAPTGSGQNVTLNKFGALATSYALDQVTLGRLTANSTGTIALAANSANNLNLSAAGANLAVSLGAIGNQMYSGSLTPQGTTYRLGGAGGNLIMANALTGANSLEIGSGGSAGTVTLNTAGTYSGRTTVTGVQGSTASVLQTNILAGASNTPFGSNAAITLTNGTLGFGTAATLSAGNVMNVAGYDVTFDTGTIRLQVGSGSSVTFTANSLNQSSLGGVLSIAPTSAVSLGTTEKVFVTHASSTIPMTVTNGMIAPKIIDSTNKTFLTYDADKGFSAATTTTLFGANNVVSIGTNPNATVSAYALRTSAVMLSSDNFTLGAGGFLSTGSQNNATGTINFGSTPGYYGVYGGGTSGTAFNATAGVTFYGTGMGINGTSLNIRGGLTFASGSWSFTPQPTGSEIFQTAAPNALILLSGAAITESQSSKMTFASIEGAGSINETVNDGFTLTINGLNSTGASTFSGLINGASGGTGNLVKTGTNTQIFAGLNSYNGTTSVNGGVLEGIQTSGTPFGVGSVAIGNGILSLAPAGSGADVALTGANRASNSTFAFNPGAQVNLDKGSNTSLTYTVGNTGAAANSVLTRGSNGTLIVTAASGTANLGTATGEKFIVNSGVTTNNGIVSAAIIGQDSNANKNGTFLAYDVTNGLKAATYTDTNFGAAASTSVEDVTSATSVNTQTVFALRSSATITLNASQTLTVGSNSASVPAGVILNGGSITGGTALAFGAAPGVVYSSVANGSIGSAITGSGGVSIMGPGVTTLSGTNTFSGGLFINDTTLRAGINGNLGTSAGGLTLNGGTLQTTASLSLGTRGVTLAIGPSNYGGVFDVAGGTILTAGGIVSGGGGLIKANTGTLTLSGANTFSGFTVVNGGTLNLSNSLALQNSTLTTGGTVFDSSVGTRAFTLGGLSGSFALSLMDNASNAVALSVGNSNSNSMTTYSGVLSDTGSLLKIGASTLTLTGASTYTGQTKIQAGTLVVSSLNKVAGGTASSSLGAPTNSGNGTMAIGATTVGATLSYVGSGETTDRIIDQAGTTGGATLSANGAGALILQGNVTATGAGIKTLTLSGSSTTNVLNEIQGIISENSGVNTTSVTKSGVGTWMLSSANTYSGVTTISGGTLMLGSAGNGTNTPLGTTVAGTSINAGGVLDLNGFTLGTAEALTLRGTGLFSNAINTGALVNSSSTAASYSGLVTLGAASKIFAGNGDIILSNAGTITGATFGLTLDGTSTGSSIASIIGNTTGGLTKTGTGTWTLTAANTYTGTTAVNDGTLEIKSGASAVSQTLGALAFTGGDGTLKSNKSSTGALSTTFTTLTARVAGNTGNIVSNGGTNGTDNSIRLTQAAGFIDKGVYFNGADFAAMNAANTYVRALGYGTDPSAATVNTITASNHVKLTATPGNQAAISLLSLNLAGGGVNWTATSGNLTVPGIIKSGGGSQSTISGGNVTTSSNAELVVRTDTASDSLAISSNLTQGSGVLTKSGAGTLTLSGTNTYTGQTFVNGGTLSIGANVNLGAQATGAQLNLRGGTLQATNTLGLFNGVAGTNNRSVVLTDSAGFDVTGANTLTVSGVVSGAGSLAKSNTGTLVLSGANAYAGATAVNAGTLVINGIQTSASGDVTVANGAKLAGTGTVGGATTIQSGGKYSAGAVGVAGNQGFSQ